jgi:hypothetical protein
MPCKRQGKTQRRLRKRYKKQEKGIGDKGKTKTLSQIHSINSTEWPSTNSTSNKRFKRENWGTMPGSSWTRRLKTKRIRRPFTSNYRRSAPKARCRNSFP